MEIPLQILPVGLVLAGQPCLVVGGGPVGAGKVESLTEARALVTVVAPTILPRIEARAARCERRPYRAGEAEAYRFVIAATGVEAVDRLVAADAERAGVFVNVADVPSLCTAILPAIGRHGGTTVAVSTGGTSPALAVWACDRIGRLIGGDLAFLTEVIGAARAEARASGHGTGSLDWRGLIDNVFHQRREQGEAAARAAAADWRSFLR